MSFLISKVSQGGCHIFPSPPLTSLHHTPVTSALFLTTKYYHTNNNHDLSSPFHPLCSYSYFLSLTLHDITHFPYSLYMPA